MLQALQVVIAALVIAFSAWLSKKSPQMAGLLVALPIASMLVLPFSYWQHRDPALAIKLAQEIFLAIPVSLMFFFPFALANRLGLTFWKAYASGITLLLLAFFLVKWSRG